jgi:hypothetical protein
VGTAGWWWSAVTILMGMALAAGGLAGAGAAVLLLTLWPARPSLLDDLAALHAPTRTPPVTTPAAAAPGHGARGGDRWLVRAGRPGAGLLARCGLPRSPVRHDLALLGIPVTEHLAEQAATAVTGLLVGPLMVWAAGLGGAGSALIAAAAGGAGGLWLADQQIRARAARRRADLRHSLSAYLDLVVLAADGGAGIDQSLTDSAQVCRGWAAEQLCGALRSAHLTRTTVWSALARLGEDTGVAELTELAATAGLAGTEGAAIRASLSARAAALRGRLLADTETRANQATERLSIPLFVLAAAFLLLLAFPALAGALHQL